MSMEHHLRQYLIQYDVEGKVSVELTKGLVTVFGWLGDETNVFFPSLS